MPQARKPRLGLTECRGSLTRRGPRTQIPGTFKKYEDGTEWWVAYCDRCGTQQIVRDHVMVRHSTEGVAFDAREHVATKVVPHGYTQPELDLEGTAGDPQEDDEEVIPF